jgi:putative transposase
MRKTDELYLQRPFFGSRKMAVELGINRKRAQRLMRLMGIEAHYAKPHVSRPAPGHEVYPYLLRHVTIEGPHHVWSSDITYIPLHGGFFISGRGDGLVQPLRAGLGALQHAGC